jgi:hypothetical protein
MWPFSKTEYVCKGHIQRKGKQIEVLNFLIGGVERMGGGVPLFPDMFETDFGKIDDGESVILDMDS